MRKNVITLATGKKYYFDLSVNLARSFIIWNEELEIDFYIVTDLRDPLPSDLFGRVKIILIKANEFGTGFSPKLHLDKIAPPGKTLFIDSDCLIFGSLTPIFQKFEGKSVSVVGNYIAQGEWFGNVDSICKKFNIPHLPKFNGGLYYLENGKKASEVYRLARDLEKDYDKIGFIRLRDNPNDEVVMSLAMQIHDIEPIIDEGTIMSDPFACPGDYQIDIKNGKTLMINPLPPNPNHRAWYKFHKVSPLIVHFLGSHTHDYQYKREVAKLPFLLKNRFNFLQNIKITIAITIPAIAKIQLKKLFRPLYRLLFGLRKIQVSERL